jgi:hypothetical protein
LFDTLSLSFFIVPAFFFLFHFSTPPCYSHFDLLTFAFKDLETRLKGNAVSSNFRLNALSASEFESCFVQLKSAQIQLADQVCFISQLFGLPQSQACTVFHAIFLAAWTEILIPIKATD